jgi:hypothetical protein
MFVEAVIDPQPEKSRANPLLSLRSRMVPARVVESIVAGRDQQKDERRRKEVRKHPRFARKVGWKAALGLFVTDAFSHGHAMPEMV